MTTSMNLEELYQEQRKEYMLLLFVCACQNCLSVVIFSPWNLHISRSEDFFFLASHTLLFSSTVNKHKPWIETSYHGVITENTDVVLLDPPLVALDKDAPIPYAGTIHYSLMSAIWCKIMVASFRLNGSSAQ